MRLIHPFFLQTNSKNGELYQHTSSLITNTDNKHTTRTTVYKTYSWCKGREFTIWETERKIVLYFENEIYRIMYYFEGSWRTRREPSVTHNVLYLSKKLLPQAGPEHATFGIGNQRSSNCATGHPSLPSVTII